MFGSFLYLSPIKLLHLPFNVAILFAALYGFTFVVIMFPFGKPDENLSKAVFELNLKRN